jgi:hypothetical protein
MGKQGKKDAAGTYIFSDEVMDEMENLEATGIIAVLEELPQDDDETVVPDKTPSRKVTDADNS